MNGDTTTIAKLLVRIIAIYFLIWGLIEAAEIVTNYVMVWCHVFLRDEIAVKPRMMTMAFEFLTFITLYYKGSRVVDFLVDGLDDGPTEENSQPERD